MLQYLTVALNAGNSKNADDYEWMASNGFVSTSKLTNLSFDKPGNYTVTLTVRNEHGDSTVQKTVFVTEETSPVVPLKAVATVSPIDGFAPLTVTLDASDSKGDIDDYEWRASNNLATSGKLTTLSFNSPGTYTITLTVKNQNDSDTIQKSVTVKQPVPVIDEKPPVAVATILPAEGIAPLTVILNASGSTGNINEYQWIASNGVASGKLASLSFDKPGNYPISLTVSNSKGDSTVQHTVIVKEPPTVPLEAIASVLPTEGFAPLKVLLDASDSKGDIDEYEWTTSNSEFAFGKRATLWFEEEGTHTITLKVTDENKQSQETKKTVVVKPHQQVNEPPVAIAEILPLEGFAPLTVTLDATGSGGQIDEYLWKSSGGKITDGKLTTLLFEEPGDYPVTLIVSNANGQDTVAQTVKVKQKLAEPPVAKAEVSTTDGFAPVQVTVNAGNSGGQIDEYQWTVVNKDTGQPVVPNIASKEGNLWFDKPGNYKITLETRNAKGERSTVTKEVTVKELPEDNPPIKAVAEITPLDDGETLELDASNSVGNIADYTWKTVDGNEIAFGKEALVKIGEISATDLSEIALTVTDNTGMSNSALRTIPSSSSIIPIITASPHVGCEPLRVTLDGQNSIGSSEIPSSYVYDWLIIDPDDIQEHVYGNLTNATLNKVGLHTISLTIRSPDRTVSYTSRVPETVLVQTDCNQISACFTVLTHTLTSSTPSVTPVNLGNVTGENSEMTVTVNADCSTGTITDYEWYVNGEHVNGGEKATIPLEQGENNIVALELSNDDGQIKHAREKFKVGKLAAKIMVENLPESAPIEKCYNQLLQNDDGDKIITLDGTVSESGIYAPTDLQYNWQAKLFESSEKGCGNPKFENNNTSNSKMFVSLNGMTACTYVVTLGITDPDNSTDESGVMVKIMPDTETSCELPPQPIPKIEVLETETVGITLKASGVYLPLDTSTSAVIDVYEWTSSCEPDYAYEFEDNGETATFIFKGG